MKEFKAWPEISQFYSQVYITCKIDGTNGIIDIEPDNILAGSRTRWLTPEDDNYGFARKVQDNKEELIAKLGVGTHNGEWYGSGISRGYGLKKGEKRFALFNAHRWTQPKREGLLPEWVDVVPILYVGPYKEGIIPEVMAKLKAEGSAIAPGFMKPEGIVIYFCRADICFKYVFEAEETPSIPKETRVETPEELEAYKFLQPIRLGKLFSKDESLLNVYPTSLPEIVKRYLEDLVKETDSSLLTPNMLKIIKKKVFIWIKQELEMKGYKG